MMDIAGCLRLSDKLEVYCVSRLCGVVMSIVSILPCFVFGEVFAVKAQAGVVRKERKSSSQSRPFSDASTHSHLIDDATVCSGERARASSKPFLSAQLSVKALQSVSTDQPCVLVTQ